MTQQPQLITRSERTYRTGESSSAHAKSNFLAAIALCLLSFPLNSVSAQTTTLANAHVSATFGDRGLVSVQEVGAKASTSFEKDAWSINVDHMLLKSDDGDIPVKTSKPNEVAYTFRQKSYAVKVVYRLEPGWTFVSKQLVLLAAPTKEFTVHSVEPLHLGLTEQPASTFVPTSYLPHLLSSPEESKDRVETKDYGLFLRYPDRRGLMLAIQNPFIEVASDSHEVALSYKPEMNWNAAWGNFVGDTACIGPYRLSGRHVPAQLVREWDQTSEVPSADGADTGEIAAYAAAVRAFIISPPARPITVEVAWTLNDYQIDIATPEGLAEYKRLIDSTSELGIKTLLYSGANSKISDIRDDTDTWRVEHLLWLNLGQQIRAGKWDPNSGPIPADMTELLNYAKSKHVGILAYVYPSLPFAQNKGWLAKNKWKEYQVRPMASLSSRAFQDFLIHELLAFKQRTGIAGYSFDYTFMNLSGSSTYAQWSGWRRVLEALRKSDPEIVIDGRQTYQMFGPWSWLAGSYPHPSGSDEQAESFMPFPDLHFDRVSADRIRFVNYWYRNYQFAPEELIPGYTTHQTERSRNIPPDSETGGHPQRVEGMYTRYRPRDWDYLGYRYSFLSSVATGGWNNVVNMIPSRDPEEAKHFSAQDKAWIRHWLEWTTAHKEYLRHTLNILGQPALGRVDGTSAIIRERGYLFLFNPNYQRLSAHLRLDASIGLTAGTRFLIKEIDPQSGRWLGKPGAGIWSYGDEIDLPLDGTSATALEIVPYTENPRALIFNTPTADGAATASVRQAQINVAHVAGEPGTSQEIGILLPSSQHITKVVIDGTPVQFEHAGRYYGAHVNFAGKRFSRAEQVSLSSGSDGVLQGSFVVPARIVKQLEARKRAWPIPWTTEDYETTWLVPGRLLLFVQTANPKNTEQIHLTLDGQPLPLKHAYSSVRAHSRAFVGLYADLSDIKTDTSHKLEVRVPKDTADKFQGVFFDNVEPDWTEAIQ